MTLPIDVGGNAAAVAPGAVKAVAVNQTPNQANAIGADALAFLERVVPWPASPQDPGFVHLVWATPDGNKKQWQDLPFRTPKRTIEHVHTLLPFPADIYFCTSLQPDSGCRSKANAIDHQA